MIVSTTDPQGRITHCNNTFVEISGYTYEELLGQPHNLLRHPDMLAEAFKDLWATVGRGRPWTGIVKNRCKNGDHYWVKAHVTAVLEGGKPVAYISVRQRANAEEVQSAQPSMRRWRPNARAAATPCAFTPAACAAWAGATCPSACTACR